MRTRLYVECGNSKCKQAAPASDPEIWKFSDEWKQEDLNSVSPPYGWIEADVVWFGPGPHLGVVVHAIECLPAAIEERLEELKHEGEI
jgi:hypothetical protein